MIHMTAREWWSNIDDALKRSDRSRSWLARQVNVSEAAISRWRNGNRGAGWPPPDTQLSIESVVEEITQGREVG